MIDYKVSLTVRVDDVLEVDPKDLLEFIKYRLALFGQFKLVELNIDSIDKHRK